MPEKVHDVARVISSTREEHSAQYSGDGMNIVFVSNRSGSEEIWTADADGRNVLQLTHFAGPAVGSPRWSPDRKWIAFDSTLGGRAGIYVIGANGERLQRVTTESITGARPSWSRDGRWIYFGSSQGSGWQIWKTTPTGSPPVQLTRNGGREAFEDPEGQFLYYTKAPPAKGIWRPPLNYRPSERKSDEEKISDAGRQGRWALGGRGVYYHGSPSTMEFLDLSTKRVTPIALRGLRLGDDASNALGASANGRWPCYRFLSAPTPV